MDIQHMAGHSMHYMKAFCLVSVSGNLPTIYFLAGGSARCPSAKFDAYSSFLLTRFCWTGVDILRQMLRLLL